MGKSTISMAIFNSYVKLPEGSKEYGRTHGKPSVISQKKNLLLNGFIDLADLEFAVRFHITHSPSEDY